jgi:hypothetical protein
MGGNLQEPFTCAPVYFICVPVSVYFIRDSPTQTGRHENDATARGWLDQCRFIVADVVLHAVHTSVAEHPPLKESHASCMVSAAGTSGAVHYT